MNRAALLTVLSLVAAPLHAQEAGEVEEPEIDEWGEPVGGDAESPETDALEADLPATDLPETAAPAAELGTTIVGDKSSRRRVGGSAHTVDEETLERLEYDDVHKVLRTVPGVYMRDEEGFGLRPNIGLRGASSDRSSKITLMEDGVPLSPAPYSAPAAYYFPLPTRLVGVEVFKGPASIRHGPQTIGGALNLRTRRVPYGTTAGIDVALGAYESGKAHAFAGIGDERMGILLEGVHLESGGFKQLEGGGPTGFSRNDVMLKARVSNGVWAAAQHALELKLGYGDEESFETYLGLSDEDFQRNANRRYRGSALDVMRWRRTQAQLRYTFVWEELDVQVVAYRHDFSRAWQKLNRFRSGPPLEQILAQPTVGRSAIYHQVLTGQADSEGPMQALLIGTNDRTFVSQGLDARARYGLDTFGLEHTFELGARLHHDQIQRLHTEDPYLMQGGELVPEGQPTALLVDSLAQSLAGALYVADEVRWGKLLVAPGLRLELIRTQLDNHMSDEATAGWQLAWLPGVGASYQALPFLSLLAGVHKGFSPVSPGQPDEVRPEEAWSFETGGRLHAGESEAELIGFFSHYTNITGECTLSSGCPEDALYRQYNGGAAVVSGLELTGRQRTRLLGVELGADLAYTFTVSRFLTSFSSDGHVFGRVKEGDELPYVPTHQAALTLGATWLGLDVLGVGSFVSAMRDRPGQGEIVPGEGADPYFLLDLAASYRLFEAGQIYVRADNVLAAEYVASRRPFGARPGKPLSFFLGYKHTFF